MQSLISLVSESEKMLIICYSTSSFVSPLPSFSFTMSLRMMSYKMQPLLSYDFLSKKLRRFLPKQKPLGRVLSLTCSGFMVTVILRAKLEID